VFNLVLLVTVSAILAMLQKWLLPLLGSSFGPSKLSLARMLFFISLASLSLSGLNTLWRATLNADERFVFTAISPIMTPTLILAALLVAGALWGVYALAFGTVLGAAGELAVSGYGLWQRGRRLVPRWYGFDRSLRKVLAQYAPMVVGAVLMGSTVLVDQAMAAMLGSGSVSALNYSNKLLAMILNIGLSSLSIAVLPSFSTLSANEDWRAMRRVLIHYTGIIAIVTIPLMLLIIAYSEPLIGLFFHGGAFTARDVHLVASVQTLLCLQLPFFSIGVLYVRAISSLKRNQILMWGTIINVTVNVVLNYVFMKMFGLPGIALSTSAVYAISCCYLCWMLFRALRDLESTTRRPSYAIAAADSAL